MSAMEDDRARGSRQLVDEFLREHLAPSLCSSFVSAFTPELAAAIAAEAATKVAAETLTVLTEVHRTFSDKVFFPLWFGPAASTNC